MEETCFHYVSEAFGKRGQAVSKIQIREKNEPMQVFRNSRKGIKKEWHNELIKELRGLLARFKGGVRMNKKICPHCGREFVSVGNNSICPFCMTQVRNPGSTEMGASRGVTTISSLPKFIKNIREKWLGTIIATAISFFVLVCLMKDEEASGAVKVIILLILFGAMFVGRMVRFLFPSVPAFWVYYLTDIVFLFVFVHLWILFGLDYESVRFIFGSTVFGRILCCCFLSLGPAQISALI